MSRGFWGPDSPSKAEGFVMAEIQDSGRVTQICEAPRAPLGRDRHRAGLAGHSPVTVQRKRGYSMCHNPLICLVAGAGFEPATFGL